MKWFLLRHYVKEFIGNRALVLLGLALPPVVVTAWTMPNALGVWTAAVMSVLGISVLPQRPSLLESALPISGKDIAAVRALIAFVLFVTPVVLAAFIVRWVHGIPFPAYEMAASCAIVVLAGLLPRLVRPREFSVPPTDTFYPVLPMAIVAALSIFYLGNVVSLTLLVVATGIAAAWWWRIVPASFEAAPRRVSARDDARGGAAVSEVAGRVPWWWMVQSTLWTKNRASMTLLMLVFGYSGNWQLLLLMLMMVEDLWQRPRWMQPLPISHRARLWMILIPGVFVPMLVTVLGMQIHVPGYDYMQSLHRGAIDTYKQEPRYFDSPSSVSLEYWEKADGPLPRITAPWGETAEPYVVRVFNRVYYNPFTSREANSDRFDNWQFERATTVVFGRPLQLKDFKDGQVNPRRVTQGPRMIVLNIAAALMFAFAVLIGTGLTKWNPAWRYPKLVGAGSIVTVLVPMGSILVAMLMYGFQQGATNVVPQLLERQLMYLATVLPSNILLVVCIVAVPVLALYAVLEWQFRNSEVVGAMPTI